MTSPLSFTDLDVDLHASAERACECHTDLAASEPCEQAAEWAARVKCHSCEEVTPLVLMCGWHHELFADQSLLAWCPTCKAAVDCSLVYAERL